MVVRGVVTILKMAESGIKKGSRGGYLNFTNDFRILVSAGPCQSVLELADQPEREQECLTAH
jgi:hypothetical protein